VSAFIKARETTCATNLSLSQIVQSNYIWHQIHREHAGKLKEQSNGRKKAS
jgi:hypothetical protein